MVEVVLYVVVFIAGGLTALVYLWLLHLSVKRIIRNTAMSWFAFFGFFFRLAFCGGAFFLCSLGGRFDRLAVSVIGFTIVRVIAISLIKSLPVKPKPVQGGKDDSQSG